MRNFEERKAEIFRRSARRIEQRRKTRKRVLLGCLPVVICAAVLSVYARPQVRQSDIEDQKADAAPAYTAVEVKGQGYYRSIEDPDVIADILTILQGEEVHPAEPETEASFSAQGREEVIPEEYRITLVAPDGENTEYILTEDCLTVYEEALHFSEDEIEALKDALDLPE